MIGADPSGIRAIIEDDTHGYTPEMIPPEAMDRLARFVMRGQHETALYFDYATGRALGEAEPGERYYQNICAPCFGFEGKAMNFSGDPDAPEYVRHRGCPESARGLAQDPKRPARPADAGAACPAPAGRRGHPAYIRTLPTEIVPFAHPRRADRPDLTVAAAPAGRCRPSGR